MDSGPRNQDPINPGYVDMRSCRTAWKVAGLHVISSQIECLSSWLAWLEFSLSPEVGVRPCLDARFNVS